MSFETEIIDTLVNDVGLDTDHVQADTLAQGTTFPAVTYLRIDTRRVRSHDGTSLVGPLFQISCWGSTPTQARELARAVVQAWDARIGFALVEDDRDVNEPNPKLFRRDVDVRLWAGLELEEPVLS